MPEPNANSGTNVTAMMLVVFALLLSLAGGGYVLMEWKHREAARAEAVAKLAELQAKTRSMAAEQNEALVAERQHFAESHFRLTNEPAIRNVLQTQQQAWNAGNIDRFMEHYWKSEDLTFSSGGKVTRGWQATLDGYKNRYATRQQMGTLAFSNLEISPLGSEAALVLGEWNLTRESDELGGKFSLVFRQINRQWLIVHDHTSKLTRIETDTPQG